MLDNMPILGFDSLIFLPLLQPSTNQHVFNSSMTFLDQDTNSICGVSLLDTDASGKGQGIPEK